MIRRPAVFVLVATNHGPMILNRLDRQQIDDHEYGVGHEILSVSEYSAYETHLFKGVVDYRRQTRGDGVFAIDGGANIGVFTIELARHMTGWGHVIGIEAQERIFYALAGNIALNNLLNTTVLNIAISDKTGSMEIPTLNYAIPSSFGSFELKELENSEVIGQEINYKTNLIKIPCFSIDSLNLERVDFIKLDIEGMELEGLKGCESTIHFHHPIIYVEYWKSGEQEIKDFLETRGYQCYHNYRNLLCFHETDAVNLKIEEKKVDVPENERKKAYDPMDAEYTVVEQNKPLE